MISTVANHELNRLIKFVSQFTADPCNKLFFRLYLIFYACKILFDVIGEKFWVEN